MQKKVVMESTKTSSSVEIKAKKIFDVTKLCHENKKNFKVLQNREKSDIVVMQKNV